MCLPFAPKELSNLMAALSRANPTLNCLSTSTYPYWQTAEGPALCPDGLQPKGQVA